MKYIDADKLKAEIERLIEESDFDESANLYSLLSFLSTLESEKPVPNDLEKAANEFANQDCVTFISRKKGFIAGAKWQAEQLLKGSPMPEDTILFNKGVAEGKRLMMEEAVEAEVVSTSDNGWECIRIYKKLHKCDDKVRIIIIKEDNHE